jgi:hypothetical protein
VLPLPGVHPKELKTLIETKAYTRMSSAAWFTISQKMGIPSVSGRMDTTWLSVEWNISGWRGMEDEHNAVTWGTLTKFCQGLGTVAHVCNPSYPGGRDWEDWGSRLAWAKSLHDS